MRHGGLVVEGGQMRAHWWRGGKRFRCGAAGLRGLIAVRFRRPNGSNRHLGGRSPLDGGALPFPFRCCGPLKPRRDGDNRYPFTAG